LYAWAPDFFFLLGSISSTFRNCDGFPLSDGKDRLPVLHKPDDAHNREDVFVIAPVNQQTRAPEDIMAFLPRPFEPAEPKDHESFRSIQAVSVPLLAQF